MRLFKRKEKKPKMTWLDLKRESEMGRTTDKTTYQMFGTFLLKSFCGCDTIWGNTAQKKGSGRLDIFYCHETLCRERRQERIANGAITPLFS